VKTIVILMLVGALLGITIASMVVPPAIAWYTSPGGLPGGGQIQAVVQIPEVIRYATSYLIRGQAIGAGIGAGLGLVIGIFNYVRSRRVAAALTQARLTPPPPV
jgi:hypothetical protein